MELMENVTVLVYLSNGAQITGHFAASAASSAGAKSPTTPHKYPSSPSSVAPSTPSTPSTPLTPFSLSTPFTPSSPAIPLTKNIYSTSTVADLRQYIDTASGVFGSEYDLLMISPSRKSLDNLNEPLCPCTVVQVPGGTKKKDEFDSDVEESGSSFYRRKVSSSFPMTAGGSYYDQMMLAFMFTATNLAGVALLALIYFNLVMFWPYITPFFWAMVVGLALRTPRDRIVSYLKPLTQIETTTKSLPLLYFKKLKYVVLETLNNRNIPYIVLGSVFCITLSVIYTSMLGMWRPAVAGVGISVGLVIIALIVFSPPTFATMFLLGGLLLLASTLCIFATTSLFNEGLALLHLLEPHFKSISEKNFAINTLLELMGIDGEYQTVLESLHEVVITKLNTTAGQFGLNISEFRTLPNLTDLSTPKIGTNLPGFTEIMNYDYSALLELITSSWAVTTRNVVMEVSWWAFGTGVYALKVVARFSTSFYNLVISGTVFVTSLYLTVVSNKNWIADAVRMVPVANTNNRIYDQIQEVFTGIVLTTFVTCGANAVCTYFIVAWGANFMLPFMYTFVNALITLFPVAYPWLLQVPLVIHLCWGGQWIRGTGVFSLFVLLAYVDAKLYTMLAPAPTSSAVFPHQWVSGLSVVMGLYAFGAQGILVGPILVYVTIILYKVFVDAMRDPTRRNSLLRGDSIRSLR